MQGIWHEWLLPPLNAIAFWASPRCGISWNEDNPDGSINQSDAMAEIGVILVDAETVAKCADCIDQLATYYYLNRNRDVATIRSLQLIFNANATLWNDLFEKILNSLLFNKKSEEALSRPIHSIFLIDSGVAEHYYTAIAATQPADVVLKLKDSMLKLTSNLDVTLEPILRDQFCEKCKEFRDEVLSYLVLYSSLL